VETSASFNSLGMVEPGSQGKDGLFIEEFRQNPLVAEDVGKVLGMILIPSTARDFLPFFFDDLFAQEKKDA